VRSATGGFRPLFIEKLMIGQSPIQAAGDATHTIDELQLVLDVACLTLASRQPSNRDGKAGDKAAKKAWKLLDDSRFRKWNVVHCKFAF